MDQPVEQDEDDPYDFKPPPGPSRWEASRRWAAEGDVESLLKMVRETPWSSISIGEQLQNVMAACRAMAKADPEGFSKVVFAEMAAFTAYLTIRTQMCVAQRVVGRGPMTCTPTLADFAPDTVDRLLPRLLEMQRGMAEVLHAQASTARTWALARAKEAQVGRVESAGRKAKGGGGPARGKAARPGRKPTVEGADGADEGVVSLPVRGRRRG